MTECSSLKTSPTEPLSSGIQSSLTKMAMEARELYLREDVPIIKNAPTPLEFHRNYVSKNLPVIIDRGDLGWAAFSKWTEPSYLLDKIGDKVITVAVTPTGFADAPANDSTFVIPHEIEMPFSRFFKIIETPSQSGFEDDTGVFYIQKQNSNFTEEFTELIPDADSHIPWATEAFGALPDAVNFWMGDGRAITSMHKDHYENLYVVVKGTKTFTLHPPTDLPFIPYKRYSIGKYVLDRNNRFHIEPVNTIQKPSDLDSTCDNSPEYKVPWIAIDPLKPDFEKYPMYRKAKQITCTVSAGQILYLPSLWFHHVTQSHGAIAVNFWYDMEYDIKYNYFKFVEGLLGQ